MVAIDIPFWRCDPRGGNAFFDLGPSPSIYILWSTSEDENDISQCHFHINCFRKEIQEDERKVKVVWPFIFRRHAELKPPTFVSPVLNEGVESGREGEWVSTSTSGSSSTEIWFHMKMLQITIIIFMWNAYTLIKELHEKYVKYAYVYQLFMLTNYNSDESFYNLAISLKLDIGNLLAN